MNIRRPEMENKMKMFANKLLNQCQIMLLVATPGLKSVIPNKRAEGGRASIRIEAMEVPPPRP